MIKISKLKLKFDQNLDFQMDAIQTGVDVFQGVQRYDSSFTLGDGTVPNYRGRYFYPCSSRFCKIT